MNLFQDEYSKDEKTGLFMPDKNFQTPIPVIKYMIGMIPTGAKTILEPSPGIGLMVFELEKAGYNVTAAEDFFKINSDISKYDAIFMNPPFSEKSAFLENAPEGLNLKGMKVGYYFLSEAMKMSNNIIALMPWFTISDSDVRLRNIFKFGLKSVTPLPRKTFEYARIQTVVIEMERGYKGTTEFKSFRF